MSWIATLSGEGLVNLDKVEMVDLRELEANDEVLVGSWGVCVTLETSEEPIIVFIGSQEQCLNALQQLFKKLPIVRFS